MWFNLYAFIDPIKKVHLAVLFYITNEKYLIIILNFNNISPSIFV